MKSGLPKPKPVHSALPIPQTPTRPSALALPPAALKSHGQQVVPRSARSKVPGSEAGVNTQVFCSNSYTVWSPALKLHVTRSYLLVLNEEER